MDKIYEMKLHDYLTPTGHFPISVIRVPGGWLYILHDEEGSSSTFVPFNNEFMEKSE